VTNLFTLTMIKSYMNETLRAIRDWAFPDFRTISTPVVRFSYRLFLRVTPYFNERSSPYYLMYLGGLLGMLSPALVA